MLVLFLCSTYQKQYITLKRILPKHPTGAKWFIRIPLKNWNCIHYTFLIICFAINFFYRDFLFLKPTIYRAARDGRGPFLFLSNTSNQPQTFKTFICGFATEMTTSYYLIVAHTITGLLLKHFASWFQC